MTGMTAEELLRKVRGIRSPEEYAKRPAECPICHTRDIEGRILEALLTCPYCPCAWSLTYESVCLPDGAAGSDTVANRGRTRVISGYVGLVEGDQMPELYKWPCA